MSDLTYAYLPGDGFITSRGHYYPEAMVREAIQRVSDLWVALPEDIRAAIEQATKESP
jgi:hypothetical protein